MVALLSKARQNAGLHASLSCMACTTWRRLCFIHGSLACNRTAEHMYITCPPLSLPDKTRSCHAPLCQAA
eukprot:9033404-Pyramimonas_sp.AAC.1